MTENKEKKTQKKSAKTALADKEKIEKKSKPKQTKIVIPSDDLSSKDASTEIIGNIPDSGNRRLATERHPSIEAIINGLYRLEKKEQALQKLQAIKDYFVVSAKLPKDEDKESVKLWIRGFKIEGDEEKEGYLGNYASLKITEVDKKFTIIAEKQRIALKYHPQRKRPIRKHPDWGHPCLRIVKKKTVFETIEEAQKVLNQLHEEYPLVTIPVVNKVYIILYSKAYEPPIKKFILEIKTAEEGGFFIESRENNFNKKPLSDKVAAPKNKEAKPDDGSKKGYFASMVELRKSKKKPSIPQQLSGFSNRITIPTSDKKE